MSRVLVARLDSDGDVLLAGPAVPRGRRRGRRSLLLVGPRGRQAAALLPGVDGRWSGGRRGSTRRPARSIRPMWTVWSRRCARPGVDRARSCSPRSTSRRCRWRCCCGWPGCRDRRGQRGLPGLAAGRAAPPAAATCPRPSAALSTWPRAGFALPPGDDGRLRVRRPLPRVGRLTGAGPYVVLHPGASVPARAWSPHGPRPRSRRWPPPATGSWSPAARARRR